MVSRSYFIVNFIRKVINIIGGKGEGAETGCIMSCRLIYYYWGDSKCEYDVLLLVVKYVTVD